MPEQAILSGTLDNLSTSRHPDSMTNNDLLIDKCKTLRDLASSAHRNASRKSPATYPGDVPAAQIDLLTVVGDLRAAAETAESALRTAVEEARRSGASWDQIAAELHVSRQAAWERFR